jgi:hypothetical protein
VDTRPGATKENIRQDDRAELTRLSLRGCDRRGQAASNAPGDLPQTFGPVIVNYIREYQLSHGVPHAQVYTITMYILAGILVIGLICNIVVRPVANK